MKDYREFYSTNKNHYHTIYHIENLLKLWEEYKEEFLKEFPELNENALITAIKWHDSYYVPGNPTNELQSVDYYMNASSIKVGHENGYNVSIGPDPLVCLIIESTQIGYDFTNMPAECKVMHDLDWSGFNDYEIFKENCEKIYQEAIDNCPEHILNEDKNLSSKIRRNQIEFYRKYAKTPLYLTKTFEKFNEIAKENMIKLSNELEKNVKKND